MSPDSKSREAGLRTRDILRASVFGVLLGVVGDEVSIPGDDTG